LPVLHSPRAQRHLEAMITLDREIDLNRGKGERGRARTRRYEKILWRANRVRTILAAAVAQVETALGSLDVLPSKKAVAVRGVERLRADVDLLAKAILNCETCVFRSTWPPVPAALGHPFRQHPSAIGAERRLPGSGSERSDGLLDRWGLTCRGGGAWMISPCLPCSSLRVLSIS